MLPVAKLPPEITEIDTAAIIIAIIVKNNKVINACPDCLFFLIKFYLVPKVASKNLLSFPVFNITLLVMVKEIVNVFLPFIFPLLTAEKDAIFVLKLFRLKAPELLVNTKFPFCTSYSLFCPSITRLKEEELSPGAAGITIELAFVTSFENFRSRYLESCSTLDKDSDSSWAAIEEVNILVKIKSKIEKIPK